MDIIKEFIEFTLFSKYAYLEYIAEILICFCYTARFFRKSKINYDNQIKIRTFLLVLIKSLVSIFIANIVCVVIVEPIAESFFNAYKLPMICRPIVYFYTYSRFEKIFRNN